MTANSWLPAAVEEERFRRVKHWAGFPREAIRTHLDIAGVSPIQIDHFAISRDPRANLLRKALFTLRNRPSPGLVWDRVKNSNRVPGANGRNFSRNLIFVRVLIALLLERGSSHD